MRIKGKITISYEFEMDEYDLDTAAEHIFDNFDNEFGAHGYDRDSMLVTIENPDTHETEIY